MNPQDRLIVALDVDTKEKALDLVEKLKNDVKTFKVGSELFTSCGPEILAIIKNNGCGIFLDLKFHDIPNTVAKAVIAATRLGVSLINVHASGGYEMMKKAVQAVAAEAKRLKMDPPKVIAVTVLTSMDENGLKKIGIDDTMEKQVLRLATLAKEAGMDGVVASPFEAKLIRKEAGDDFIIVTPGVRPEWAAVNDQKRIATPKEAVLNGANYIVVGRPITEAPDPLDAAKRILEEILN
ncbi:MAG: orotidine-5'-phosphate decarboxylase [Candidatus Omnitrophota bacterium]|nr:orotidine-5'-phosphate decarboxylase [Candidatus Omnitrophota bacterium]